MKTNHTICLLTDFGINNRFTGIMKGIACSIDPEIKIFDITHEVEPFNIKEASYLLSDCIKYWPEGTVFAAIVDPGVGSERKPVGILTAGNHYIICPDNGLLTVTQKSIGIMESRIIDVRFNKLPGITASTTFDGRDIFIYNAARLASGKIKFSDLGMLNVNPLIHFSISQPEIKENKIIGSIIYIEYPFGNLCTNINSEVFKKLKWKTGEFFKVRIYSENQEYLSGNIKFVNTFSDVGTGELLLYIDSESRLGIGKNMESVIRNKKLDLSGQEFLVDIERLI